MDTPRGALVTGSSLHGLGRTIAERLAQDGHIVGISSRTPSDVEQTVAEMRAQGWPAFAAPGDVTKAEDIQRMVDTVVREAGGIGILVNNAGGVSGVNASASFEEFSEEAWHAIIDRNLTSTFLCCRAAVPHMKAARWGRIINIASESARVPIVPRIGGYAYASAKSGVLGLSRVLAHELAIHGITVNVVAPGLTLTERVGAVYNGMTPDQQKARVSQIKRGYPGEPREVAGAVAYLASEDAGYTNGAVLDVNGGSFMP
ncbi:MAG TPA: SDR family oxidoreductase [Chloroflexota bacterium]|nr:SDR family oxidoreductase [Chloroflexota bacterium]